MWKSGLVALSVLAACRGPSRVERPRNSGAVYDADAMWLCRPDLPGDACHRPADATRLAPDGSRTVVPFVAAVDPPVDCFYIYPTVDLDLRPGNHTDFENLERMQHVAQAQIARFRSVCNVYAPLYRQVSIGTYFNADANKRFFDIAYSDVAAAFHHYLTHFDRGHKLVIIGHSQGAQMATRLLHDTFDQSPALRARLVVGMPIGYDANIPDGGEVGGSFDHLPACATDDQSACIVAYRSISVGDTPSKHAFPLPPGHRSICVNPGGAGKSDTPLTTVALARDFKSAHADTPYVIEDDYFHGRCVPGPGGKDFLEISRARADDPRPGIVNIDHVHGLLGLHIYDFQLPQDDLIQLITTKLAGMRQASEHAAR